MKNGYQNAIYESDVLIMSNEIMRVMRPLIEQQLKNGEGHCSSSICKMELGFT